MQHYDWGDTASIPTLTGWPNPQGQPCAELWMGAHPDLPSEVSLDGSWHPLDKVIAHSPEIILGSSVKEAFQEKLPFLLKLLAAAHPLSIQVHPTKKAAETGFGAESRKNIPLNAPHRNYKDDNHKPELIAALSPLYALRGFRPWHQIRTCLEGIPEFQSFLDVFEDDPQSLSKVYENMMRLSPEETHALLDPEISRLRQRHQKRPFSKNHHAYWILRSDARYARNGLHDRGLFSMFLLNLVCLDQGQAMYLPAGVVHAYLEGFGIELMANSNNVLRGGLTSKHVDVDELLKHVCFEGAQADILEGKPQMQDDRRVVYQTPASEFQLQQINANQQKLHMHIESDGPEILIPSHMGEDALMILRAEDKEIRLDHSAPILVCAGVKYDILMSSGASLFRALVPSKP
jgi:mannose-6-phosphate isomerase